MSALWAFLVNGRPIWMANLAAIFAAAVLRGDHWLAPIIAGSLFLLNLASWDYQRRHGWAG
jgi:hypothetical protein